MPTDRQGTRAPYHSAVLFGDAECSCRVVGAAAACEHAGHTCSAACQGCYTRHTLHLGEQNQAQDCSSLRPLVYLAGVTRHLYKEECVSN